MLAASDAPIGVVVAPPGFGKTTLLVQWQASSERPFAWLSLDDTDNDPVAFWSCLVASIDRVVPDFAHSVVPALSSMGGLALDAVVARILNELDALDEQIVLVLDDYHRITNRECHDTLALLLERLPSTLQLIISTRSDPPLPVARWRANGRVTELRAADLSFTDTEAAEALNRTWGLDLSAESIAILHERTEGWPAGLYLACLSVRGSSDPAALVADFGGATRLVIDYLMEVVLEQQGDELGTFLLDTSVLDGLCGPLCDAVTERDDSTTLLARLEHENLFIVALDDRRDWFRYHHLFAQALNEELSREHPERRPILHQRAGEWFEARGDFGQAIRHAFAGGDLDTAAALVATHSIDSLNLGRLATVSGWLATFPRPIVEADARLLLVEAWISGLQGDAEGGLHAVSAAQRVGHDGELPDGSGTVEESAALIRATFPWSDVGAMLSAARSAHTRQRERASPWQALAALDLGWALILAGAPDQAREPLMQAVTLASRSEQWVAAGDARALLAEISAAAADLEPAEAWIHDALEMATRHGYADLPQVGHYHVVAGTIHARRGNDEEADRLISIGLRQMRGSWEPLHVAQALLSLAAVRHSLGARGEARAMLDEARALIDACHDPGSLRDRLKQATHALVPAYRRADQDTKLTERELEVLRVLAAGATEREAATKLFVSHSTIHSHTKSIYHKLGCTSRDEAVARVRELGLLT
ncbi:LuxR C-terminal-related transcriptional regulator [Kribbella qitaiheensis]|uniref:helix-turn-helix transcriptional regulator n=1 Tax=Kribbella qitaiheensis TaxID=1544730 RepID=UPI0036094865